MTKTVSEILADTFGSDFSAATQDQRFLLLEAVALCLRTGSSWQHMLGLACSRTKATSMPNACFPCIQISRNEGLKLLAVLNEAIVDGYSTVAANERLTT